MARSKHQPQKVFIVPDWLPDWRDAKLYPKPKEISLKQWAWEFLRRNPEYQKQWEETIAPWVKSDKGFDTQAAMDAEYQKLSCDPEYQKRWQEFQKRWPEPGAAKNINEAAEVFDRLNNDPEYRTASAAFAITNPMKVLQDRFGIDSLFLLPPSRPSSLSLTDMRFTNNLGGVMGYEPPSDLARKYFPVNWPYEITVPLKRNETIFVFDMELPIEPQIRNVKSVLKYKQKFLCQHCDIKVRNPRNRRSNYPLYLRLLDGEARGASHGEMQEIIGGRGWRVCDALKAAKRLRDTDYKFICRPITK